EFHRIAEVNLEGLGFHLLVGEELINLPVSIACRLEVIKAFCRDIRQKQL
ncbi:MAG: hypothetical protein G8D89_15160, partial [gamma proteobacterium symbiont of Clathrolucina costata]